MDIAELETFLRGLLKGEHSSLTIGFNDDFAANYMNAEEWYAAPPYNNGAWLSEEDKAAAIEANAVWTLQWYPDTPVGSYSVAASSLEKLLEAARQ